MPNIHSNISFGLVNIPVLMNPIIRDNDTSFNQLHKTCLNRINYIKYCHHCKKEVKEKDIIKGYAYEKNKYITFPKEELDKLKPEKNDEIEIISFIDFKEVDPIYLEKSYILKTEKQSKAYNLFCEALRKSKKVGLAKTVLGTKLYYCLLRFSPFGIIMTTLFYKEEVILPDDEINLNVSDKELNLAMRLIDEETGKFEPDKYQDEYQNNIREAIDDKIEGKPIKTSRKKAKKQVNDLLEALEKSLKKK